MTELFDQRREYAAPSGARLTYRGGALMNSPKLFGVFVDDFSLSVEMNDFLKFLATSDVLAELKEYNVSGSGAYLGNASLSLSGSTPPPPPPPPPVPGPSPCPPGCQPIKHPKHHKGKSSMASASNVVTDQELQQFLANSISAGSLPAPDNETLFVLFLPDGMTVQLGPDASCSTFCGYHDSFSLGSTSVAYAVLPFPSCSGCLGGLSAVDALTSTTSHEVCEAITDPVPGAGWYDDVNGEIGDICAWQFRQDGQFNVQLEWSNRAGSCI